MTDRTWWKAPRLRTDEDERRERKVSWLDLFYDLVFVVVISQIAHTLATDVSAAGLFAYVVLFLPAWWMWIGSTIYAERFESDDLSHRLLTFAQMLPAAALAVFVHDGTGGSSAGFALSYAAARAVLAFAWLRAGWHQPSARPLTSRLAAGFSISIALFIASILVPLPLRLAFWGVGILVDLLTPLLTIEAQRRLPRFSSARLGERFGQLTLIVLGESVVAVVQGTAQAHHLDVASASSAALAMGIAFSLWIIYFDVIASRSLRPHLGYTMARSYLHLPLVMAIAGMAAGVLNVLAHRGADLPAAVHWLTGGALATALVTMGVLDRWVLLDSSAAPRSPRTSISLFGGAGALLVLGAAGERLGEVTQLVASLAVLGFPVLGAVRRRREPEPHE